jgi:hypothetical protein
LCMHFFLLVVLVQEIPSSILDSPFHFFNFEKACHTHTHTHTYAHIHTHTHLQLEKFLIR